MSKHTPGPWKWGDNYRGLYGQGEGRQCEVLTFEPYEGMWLSYTDHQDANARLIEAAPLMYEALEDALRTCESEMQYILDNGRLREVLRAALQEAKGGDQ